MDHGSTLASQELLRENLCLDFLNPVIAHGKDDYFMSSFECLVDWGLAVGTVDEEEARSLLGLPASRVQATMQYAKSTRDVLRAIFANRAAGGNFKGDLEALNSAYFRAVEHRRVTLVQDRFAWKWVSDGDPGMMFWPAISAAVDLLLSPELTRLKSCKGCGWLFLDTSKNHSRRWCRMKDCGNREKVRSFRRRFAESAPRDEGR